jgi:hypothetical protein
MASETQELSEAIVSWLTYKNHTGLKGLLREGSLSIPIAEFLSSGDRRNLKPEVTHPRFRNDRKGRPVQLDFVRLREGEATWYAAYESKFGSPSFSAIVEDICRLACLSGCPEINVGNRYLVIADTYRDPDSFLSIRVNAGGGRIHALDGILHRTSDNFEEELRFDVLALHDRQKVAFEEFARSYANSDDEPIVPQHIRTRLVGLSRSSSFICGVWRVSLVQNTRWLACKDI